MNFGYLLIHILKICVEKVELFQWMMCTLIWFGVEISGYAFHSDVVEHVEVRMCFWKIPILLWPKNFEFLDKAQRKMHEMRKI
jgi:hypothetical protein